MSKQVDLEKELSTMVHNLFLDTTYEQWRNELPNQKFDRWWSLIAEVEKSQVSTKNITQFGENVYPKLVYRCVPAPRFNKTGELMVLFNVSGLIWHSLIYFAPELN